jgi:HK97 family phage major capsid protein
LVPTGFDAQLHTALKNYGALVGPVGQLVTGGGGPIQVAAANDTGNDLAVIGQAVAVSETDASFAGSTSNTDILTSGVVKISESLLQDSQFDLDSWIQNAFSVR